MPVGREAARQERHRARGGGADPPGSGAPPPWRVLLRLPARLSAAAARGRVLHASPKPLGDLCPCRGDQTTPYIDK